MSVFGTLRGRLQDEWGFHSWTVKSEAGSARTDLSKPVHAQPPQSSLLSCESHTLPEPHPSEFQGQLSTCSVCASWSCAIGCRMRAGKVQACGFSCFAHTLAVSGNTQRHAFPQNANTGMHSTVPNQHCIGCCSSTFCFAHPGDQQEVPTLSNFVLFSVTTRRKYKKQPHDGTIKVNIKTNLRMKNRTPYCRFCHCLFQLQKQVCCCDLTLVQGVTASVDTCKHGTARLPRTTICVD